MKSLTKLQKITIIALILFVVWEIYVKRWEANLPAGDPAIRVDLVLFIPVLLGLVIGSIVQFMKKK